ncbi:hypothetical protein J6590_103800 [Homalodisca vitripennis]|nr:hypothetical protein J6590_103800 [Homalodisca vitripennis]
MSVRDKFRNEQHRVTAFQNFPYPFCNSFSVKKQNDCRAINVQLLDVQGALLGKKRKPRKLNEQTINSKYIKLRWKLTS